MNGFNFKNICSLFFLTFLICACSSDPFPNFDIPVYENSVNIQHTINKPAKGVKTVVYYNKISFPANDLIVFYDKEFKKVGYVPFSKDGYGLRRWEVYNYKSGEWETTSQAPARYISTWTDHTKKIRVVLSMAYKFKSNPKDKIRALFVSCTISPFFDFRKIEPPEFPE